MVRQLLLGVIVPAAVCGVFSMIAWRPWRRDADAPLRGGEWGTALGFAAALLAAFAALGDWPALRPVENWKWLFHLLVAAGLVGVVDGAPRAPAALRWALRLGLAAACGWLLVGAWVDRAWLWRPVVAALVLAVHATLATRRAGGAALPIGLAVASAAASVVLIQAYNSRLAILAAALAACFGVAALLAMRTAAVTCTGGAAVAAVVLPGTLLSGWFTTTSAVPAWAFVVAAAAPVALLAERLPLLRGLGPRTAGIARVAAISAPALVALVAALLSGGNGDTGPYGY